MNNSDLPSKDTETTETDFQSQTSQDASVGDVSSSPPMMRMEPFGSQILTDKDSEDPYQHHGDNMPSHTHHDEEVKSAELIQQYWSANVRLLFGLLAVWFVVSFGAGILFVDVLNKIQFGGFPLGFWFAQQGAILIFVGLIFFYTHRMKKIERRFGIDDD